MRHRPISAYGAQEEAFWWLLMGVYVRLFGGMAPRKEEIAGQARDEEGRDGGCPLGGGGTGTERGRRSRRGTDGHVFAGFSCP